MQGKGFIQYHQKDKKITGSMTSQYRLQYYTIATYNNYAQTQTKSSEREKVRTSDREGEIYTSPNHTINDRDNIHLPLQQIDIQLYYQSPTPTPTPCCFFTLNEELNVDFFLL